jgi:gluconate kinase
VNAPKCRSVHGVSARSAISAGIYNRMGQSGWVTFPKQAPALCVVIMGPKAVGKSRVANVLDRCCGVHHVDPDEVILRLIALGERPDPETGWLAQVEAALDDALRIHDRISTEATGAWDSDWLLIRDLGSRGVIVRTIWVAAPLDLTLTRLAARSEHKVPTTADEAAWYHREATRKAHDVTFDLVLDGSGLLDDASVVTKTRLLLTA